MFQAAEHRVDGVQHVANGIANLFSPLRANPRCDETSLYSRETMYEHLPEWMVNQIVDDVETTDAGDCSNCNASDGFDNFSSSGTTTPAEYARPAGANAFGLEIAEEAEQAVALDPAEGKRRGVALLSMLKDGPVLQTSPPPVDPGSPARHAGVQDRPGCRRTSGDTDRMSLNATLPQYACQGQMAPWTTGSYAGSSISNEHLMSFAETPFMEDVSNAMQAEMPDPHLAAVREASRRAFGVGVVGVNHSSYHGGLTVRLRGGPAAELRSNPAVVLEALGHSLWPLLDHNIVSLDHYVDGVRVTGSSMPPLGRPATARLTMRHLPNTDNVCWDFARRGACPRGDSCRWKHMYMQTMETHIEVVC